MICYELWGNDTYSNETFLCGVYKHYSSARRAMKKHELDCQEYQGEGLRDTFWISKTSIEEHDEQADKRSRFISSIHRKLKDDKNLVMKTDMKMDDDILKKAGISWAKRKAMKLALAIMPAEKATYHTEGDMIIVEDEKEPDTMRISADGKYIYGKMDEKTKFTLTRTK